MSPEAAKGPAQRRGLMLVLSSPSGAGKTTLSHMLLGAEPEMELSVSVTTRAPRPGEADHVDYHFIGQEAFDSQARAGELLEYAEVFGKSYGTPRAPVEAALSAGRDVLFDIDWQGARQLKAAAPADFVSIFILPPSADALRERLVRRGQDSADVIAQRMAKASAEISHWPEYDYIVVNDDLSASHAAIRAILTAERLKRARRQAALEAHADKLNAELARFSAPKA